MKKNLPDTSVVWYDGHQPLYIWTVEFYLDPYHQTTLHVAYTCLGKPAS